MPLNPNASVLLYVPFDKDNAVETEMKKRMTTKEFFNECFVHTNFQKKIRELECCSDSEIEEHESCITKKEMIDNLHYNEQQLNIFDKWLNDNASSPYVIMGVAGSGKTTFVNYYKHKEEKNRIWNLLDLQSANREILIDTKPIRIEKKNTLREMIISIVLLEIVQTLFLVNNPKNVSQKNILRNICFFKSSFLSKNNKLRHLQRTVNFFKNIPVHRFGYNNYNRVVNYIHNEFNEILDNKKLNSFDVFLDIYFSILKIKNGDKQNVIVIDNLERFIKTTEIYSWEIIGLMQDLRTIVDRNRLHNTIENIDQFSECFRFVVAMRRTTIRLFTTQQTAEYLPHILDISNWFQVNEIIHKKIAWLRKNNFEHLINMDEKYENRMTYILDDVGFADGIARGLQQKLDYLFNYDKRIIIEILNEILCNPNNKSYLEKFDEYTKQKILSPQLCRFAARNLIIRLILNCLAHQDEFMKYINHSDERKSRERLNYVRKILTVLQNYYRNEQHENYVNLSVLISKSINLPEERMPEFYQNKYYEHSLNEISEALFFMNYYNRRDNNWIQLIDIQCNELESKIEVKSATEMLEFIKKHKKKIKVTITSTGNAYLDYIVQTFEFFSCYYSSYAPLVCLLPTKDVFLTTNIHELECIKVIKDVSSKVITFINDTLLNDEFVYYNYNGKGQKYSERIVNYHVGHIKNFVSCVFQYYQQLICLENIEGAEEKIKELYKVIEDVESKYNDVKPSNRK